MFITPAYAQTGLGGSGDLLGSLVPILAMFIIFYFLLFRAFMLPTVEARNALVASFPDLSADDKARINFGLFQFENFTVVDRFLSAFVKLKLGDFFERMTSPALFDLEECRKDLLYLVSSSGAGAVQPGGLPQLRAVRRVPPPSVLPAGAARRPEALHGVVGELSSSCRARPGSARQSASSSTTWSCSSA